MTNNRTAPPGVISSGNSRITIQDSTCDGVRVDWWCSCGHETKAEHDKAMVVERIHDRWLKIAAVVAALLLIIVTVAEVLK